MTCLSDWSPNSWWLMTRHFNSSLFFSWIYFAVQPIWIELPPSCPQYHRPPFSSRLYSFDWQQWSTWSPACNAGKVLWSQIKMTAAWHLSILKLQQNSVYVGIFFTKRSSIAGCCLRKVQCISNVVYGKSGGRLLFQLQKFKDGKYPIGICWPQL